MPAAPHLVYISVVGADRIPVVSGVDRAMFGYFAAKRAAELVVADSGLPWTTLRATQFHDLILMVVGQLAKLPVMPVPAGIRFQPVDTGEVAARLVELVLGSPAGLVPDMAGPRVYGMDELVRGYLRASHRHRLIMPVRLPGKAVARSGPAPTSPPNEPSAGEPGRSSWPTACPQTGERWWEAGARCSPPTRWAGHRHAPLRDAQPGSALECARLSPDRHRLRQPSWPGSSPMSRGRCP